MDEIGRTPMPAAKRARNAEEDTKHAIPARVSEVAHIKRCERPRPAAVIST